MTERHTIKRSDPPGVMVVGASPTTPPAYVRTLLEADYVVTFAATAEEASAKMAELMPHVVILAPAVPMVSHRLVHETALAIGAVVLLIPDSAHPMLVCGEVDEARERALKRRSKTVPPP